ncbi:peptidase C39 family protein [Streptomyces sp. PU_AKi4]|uniref:peptidase C39 family protein n=1 Tax=Streptomyces sp. PU_AKi4 TaxID=2800809 RepID=UPI0035266C55
MVRPSCGEASPGTWRREAGTVVRRCGTAAGRSVHGVLLARMQGFEVPHRVPCHAAVPGAVVIEDPWADAATGTPGSTPIHCPLPVPDPSFDTMSVLSAEGFRGAVTIGRPHPWYPGYREERRPVSGSPAVRTASVIQAMASGTS